MENIASEILKKGKERVDVGNIRTIDSQIKFLIDWLNEIDAEKEAEELYQYYLK